MKNNYIKNKKDVYNHLFKTNDESLNESVNGYQNNYISKNIDIQ